MIIPSLPPATTTTALHFSVHHLTSFLVSSSPCSLLHHPHPSPRLSLPLHVSRPPPPPITCLLLHSSLLHLGSFGDPSLSSASTLEHIPNSAARPRPLVRQQSLQQPLTHQPPPGPNDPPATSQSLGQLHTGPGGGGHRGGPRGVRGSPAGAGSSRYRGGGGGGRSRSNPGSVDHVMVQIRRRGLDVKSFL